MALIYEYKMKVRDYECDGQGVDYIITEDIRFNERNVFILSPENKLQVIKI